MSTTRICPRCSGHFDIANWVCPHCGAEFARPRPARAGWLQRMAPYPGALTKAVIGFTAIIFVLQLIAERNGGASLRMHVRMGALVADLVNLGQVWRLVTPILLHADFFHILFNMFSLYMLGPMVETTFGRARFLALYLGAGISGCLASHLLGGGAVSVGASGAVCGFLGVLAVWGFRRGGTIGAQVRRRALMWAGIILVWGLMKPGVDNAGHLGGFLGGGALAFLMAPKDLRTDTALRRRVWNVIAAGVLVVTGVCVIAAGVYFVKSGSVDSRMADVRRFDVLLAQAARDLQLSAEILPPPPAAVAERDIASVTNGLEVAASRLVKDAPNLGGDPGRAAEVMAGALRRRAAAVRARAAPTANDEATVAAAQARKIWVGWLRWYWL